MSKHEGSSTTAVWNDAFLLARILSFLDWRTVVTCRAVARAWRAAPKPVQLWTISQPLSINMARSAVACLPHLQALEIRHSAQMTPDVFGVLWQQGWQSTLRRLDCIEAAALDEPWLPSASSHRESSESGHDRMEKSPPLSSPSQANFLPLQALNVHNNSNLPWNLRDLIHTMPHLHDLRVVNNRAATGELAAQDLPPWAVRQLTVLDISGCVQMTGTLLYLAKHGIRIQWLGLNRTAVVGDVRQISAAEDHFPALQWIGLEYRIYGANSLSRVSHAAAIMLGRHALSRNSSQSHNQAPIFPFLVRLAETSPDYHERIEQRLYSSERDPPFTLQTVAAAGRRGWRWTNLLGGCCEIHWLDPEPQFETTGSGSDDYDEYKHDLWELQQETQASMFAGFWDPPTPQQYARLCQEK